MTGVLLITGGSRGIGAATARLAAAEGYQVAVNYRTARAAAEAVVAEIETAGGRACALAGDVAEEADVVRLFEAVEERLGPPSALVNSAGISPGKCAVADFEADRLARLIAVNVVGTMLCCREAVRRMSTARGGAGGAIVNVSSMAAVTGGRPGSSHYAATKAAVDTLHHRIGQGGRARGHPGQRRAAGHDADRHDRARARRSVRPRRHHRHHRHETGRRAGGNRAAHNLVAVRGGLLRFRLLPRRLRRRLHDRGPEAGRAARFLNSRPATNSL